MPARLRSPATAVALAGAILAGCGADSPGAAPTPSPTPTVEPAPDPLVLDWSPRSGTIDLGADLTLEPCEGDAPLWCVLHGAELLGAIELFDYPADGEDLDARVEDFLATFEEDRLTTCGGDHRFVPLASTRTPVASTEGVRFGFEVRDPDGAVTEKVVRYLAVLDDTVVIIGASAYTDDGCPGRQFASEFTVEGLGAVEPHLDRIAAGSRYRP
jgi:hypothetical protein